jgi:leucyl aminopeptidase
MNPISPIISLSANLNSKANTIWICTNEQFPSILSQDELSFVQKQKSELKQNLIKINRYNYWLYLVFPKSGEYEAKRLESLRQVGNKICQHANSQHLEVLQLTSTGNEGSLLLALAEGILLGNYQFIHYRSDMAEKQHKLQFLHLVTEDILQEQLDMLSETSQATLWARDLVNEPVNKLNAEELAARISETIRTAGGKAEVLNLQKIEALKMGGLLGVNRGSLDHPAFVILEWKPENPVNEKPIVLVGKGVVYDTGGYSLKTGSFMENMKCDMAGAAAVSAIVYAAASTKLPVHVIALVPATDNRLDGNALVPGDIITTMDGTTVEVLNTDAEGRLILADALTYAKKYDPALVINFATLTGSAQRAIGPQGIVAMQSGAREYFNQLAESGLSVHERLVEFPLWDEYKEQILSKIADLKNTGGAEAGAITAGKFLEHFTAYPFIHLDIAAPAFLDKADSYRVQGGSGVCVRLVYDFLKKMASV